MGGPHGWPSWVALMGGRRRPPLQRVQRGNRGIQKVTLCWDRGYSRGFYPRKVEDHSIAPIQQPPKKAVNPVRVRLQQVSTLGRVKARVMHFGMIF